MKGAVSRQQLSSVQSDKGTWFIYSHYQNASIQSLIANNPTWAHFPILLCWAIVIESLEKDPCSTNAITKMSLESFWNTVKTLAVVTHNGACRNRNNREKQIHRPSFLWCSRQQKQNLQLFQRHCTQWLSCRCNKLSFLILQYNTHNISYL